MARLLSMPKRFQTDANVQRLIRAKGQGDFVSFCGAYQDVMGRNPTLQVRALLDRASGGDSAALEELWIRFLDRAVATGQITDPKVAGFLKDARSPNVNRHKTAAIRVYDYLQYQVDTYAKSKLYPSRLIGARSELERADAPPALSDDDANNDASGGKSSPNLWEEEWNDLRANIEGAAERLWRDAFLAHDLGQGEFSEGSLEGKTEVAHRLLQLWLEATLYRVRSIYNVSERNLRADASIRKQIGEQIASYRHMIGAWDTELAQVTRKRYFQSRGLESQQLRRLIRQFGTPEQDETGWATLAAEAEAELRYQTREEARREMRATGHPGAALFMTVLRITTGYGTRPLNFIRTALGLWFGAALAFYANDGIVARFHPVGKACIVSQPHLQQWTDWLSVLGSGFVHYLYVAATTLTSLGVDTNLASYYCSGATTQIILALSTISGYFMLGLLAALLYAQLTQRA